MKLKSLKTVLAMTAAFGIAFVGVSCKKGADAGGDKKEAAPAKKEAAAPAKKEAAPAKKEEAPAKKEEAPKADK